VAPVAKVIRYFCFWGLAHLCLPLLPWITTCEAAPPFADFRRVGTTGDSIGAFRVHELGSLEPRRLGLTNNEYSVGGRGTHLSKIAKGGAASVVHGLEAALRSARRFRPVRAFGGGASWAQGRSRECLDAVRLWQRVQGSFDSAGLRFAYPAPLRMTIFEVAIEYAVQFDQGAGQS